MEKSIQKIKDGFQKKSAIANSQVAAKKSDIKPQKSKRPSSTTDALQSGPRVSSGPANAIQKRSKSSLPRSSPKSLKADSKMAKNKPTSGMEQVPRSKLDIKPSSGVNLMITASSSAAEVNKPTGGADQAIPRSQLIPVETTLGHSDRTQKEKKGKEMMDTKK